MSADIRSLRPVSFGVDIGGTKTAVGAMDAGGTRLGWSVFPTRATEPFALFLDHLTRTIEGLSARLPEDCEPVGVGVAAPAADAATGRLDSPANLSWGSVAVAVPLESRLHLPVRLANDGYAAALGERLFGSAVGLDNFVLLTLGTGLGTGIVVDGNPLRGAHGLAGEVGHLVVEPGGRRCGCGRAGCLETYVSVPGIRRTVAELLAHETGDNPMRHIAFATLSAEDVSRLAAGGDPLARQAFVITGTYLGRALADLAAVFDPGAIILSGGLVNAGELLLAPTRTAFDENILGMLRGKVELRISRLNNGEAAVLGAASIAAGPGRSGEPWAAAPSARSKESL